MKKRILVITLLLVIVLLFFEIAKTYSLFESNGNGEILWDKTINDFYPIIQNNRPYYVELFTKNTKFSNIKLDI